VSRNTGGIPIEINMKSIDWQGRSIKLENVPAIQNQKKEIRVNIDDVIKAEQIYLANEYSLSPINFHELLLLHASPRFIKGGYIEQKFRFNKMLFYLWKEMEKVDYRDSYIYDTFKSGRAGPIPINLKRDLIDLEEKGFIELLAIKDGKKIDSGNKVLETLKPGISLRCQLTKKGEEIAKSLWGNTPDDIKEIILKVKKELFLIDATKLKEKVHKDFPEYKKTYIELDAL